MFAHTRSYWLCGIDPQLPRRESSIQKDRHVGMIGLSAIDSTGVTRFRLYVFNDADEVAASALLDSLLKSVDTQ
jgi:hypothetical protein